MRVRIKSTYLVVIPLSFSLLLGGCSEEPKEKATNNEVKTKEDKNITKKENTENEMKLDAPKAPTTYEEVLEYPSGKFAGQPFDKNKEEQTKELDKFPVLDEKASDEDAQKYFDQLVSLYAESYPQPVDTIKQTGFGNPTTKDPRYKLKKNYNVEIILDASGSMAQIIGGRTKMDIAKAAIKEFTSSLPKEAKVGLRVYGFKGSNADSDKKISCSSNELVYKMKSYNDSEFNKALGKFNPTGWTPVAKSLEWAAKDLSKYDAKNNTNVIYLVSDGIETCDGDPVQSAKKLNDSNVEPIVNIIGFDVDQKGQKQLKDAAKAAEGLYADAANQEQLKEQFNRSKEDAEMWSKWLTDEQSLAYEVKKKNYNTLLAYRNETRNKADNEMENIRDALKYLEEKKKITSLDQSLFISKKIQNRNGEIDHSSMDLYGDLLTESSDGYFKRMDEISEKFKEKQ